jgi:hypothetical protein
MCTDTGEANVERPIASCIEKPATRTSDINTAEIRKNLLSLSMCGRVPVNVAIVWTPIRTSGLSLQLFRTRRTKAIVVLLPVTPPRATQSR